MAGLGPARSVHLALLFCIGARALRSSGVTGQPQLLACSRVVCRNPFVTFPLNVNGLLHTFHQDKSKFFTHLSKFGVTGDKLTTSVPHRVGTDCLGPAHFIFVGDSLVQETYTAFLGSRGKGLATNLVWFAGPIDKNFTDWMRDTVAGIGKATPGVQIVFWFNALLHGWFTGERAWTMPEQRKKLQTTLITHIRKAYPHALVVWDSPTFVDLPLMQANPPKERWPVLREANASRVSAALAAQDRQVMASLGVPLTLRWEVSSKYRGLQCDGLHAMPHYNGEHWNCSGFPAPEDLILQSGLQQLCLKRKMHLCL